MRVIHVITRLIVGGAQENTIASVLGLRRKPGVRASLISGPATGPEGSLAAAFDQYPDALTVLPDLVRPVHPWKDARAWRRLVRLFRAERPDIVLMDIRLQGPMNGLEAAREIKSRWGIPIIFLTAYGEDALT